MLLTTPTCLLDRGFNLSIGRASSVAWDDHVRRVNYRVAGLRDTLTSVIETSGLLEQQRQGAITRQLAAWAAILAVPTAIAGIYGMNFDVMPELRWAWGYPAVMALIGTICVGLWLRFRKIGWL